MIEAEVEALILHARTEARVLERKRIKEIKARVQAEAEERVKREVTLAQNEIRSQLNERITQKAVGHAGKQSATLAAVSGDSALLLRVHTADGAPLHPMARHPSRGTPSRG